MFTPTQADVVERIGAALAEAGVARLPSRVFAALLVDDDGRMTAAELSEGLRVSRAAVSGAVKYLAQVGMLRREREPGGRRDVYVVDDDAWHGAMMRHDQVYGPIRNALSWGITTLGDDAASHRRLALTHEFLRFLEEEMDTLSAKWEVRKAALEADGRLQRSPVVSRR